MQNHPASYQVFVDLENVPEIDLGLVEDKPVHVTLLIGKNQKKFDVTLVRQIHRLAAQVELVEVGASGHNALDLTLAFYLGQSVQRFPDAHCCIVSKDKDFEPMIAHLNGKRVKVSRHDSFATLPFLSPPKAPAATAKKPPEDRRIKVISLLKNPSRLNRPTSRKTLLAYIKASLGKDSSEDKAEDILRELCAEHTLTIDAKDKVTYSAAR